MRRLNHEDIERFIDITRPEIRFFKQLSKTIDGVRTILKALGDTPDEIWKTYEALDGLPPKEIQDMGWERKAQRAGQPVPARAHQPEGR